MFSLSWTINLINQSHFLYYGLSRSVSEVTPLHSSFAVVIFFFQKKFNSYYSHLVDREELRDSEHELSLNTGAFVVKLIIYLKTQKKTT